MRPRAVARVLAGAIVCLTCVAWLDSPLRLSAARRVQMISIAPQFWGFFATPREARFEIFRRDNGVWKRVDAPLGATANIFGLRRTIPNNSAEFRTLEAQVADRWVTVDLAPDQLPETAGKGFPVKNFARQPLLCRDVLLVSRTPLPWAWARANARVALPARVAQLDVQC